MAKPADRRAVSDVRALAALAHPVRIALLSHLMAVGPRTASECAAAVDESPSNCSWHLRQLAKHGFAERAGATDGRERPWQATATGFTLDTGADGPAFRVAVRSLASVQLDEQTRLAKEHLRREDELPEAWRNATDFSTYGLLMTPDELRALTAALDAAIRPFVAATRDDAPPGARAVQVSTSAFLRPDAP